MHAARRAQWLRDPRRSGGYGRGDGDIVRDGLAGRGRRGRRDGGLAIAVVAGLGSLLQRGNLVSGCECGCGWCGAPEGLLWLLEEAGEDACPAASLADHGGGVDGGQGPPST